MDRQSIIDKIRVKVMDVTIGGKNPPLAKKYTYWYIGVTDNPAERRSYHEQRKGEKKVKLWEHWSADNEAVARNVEKHFLDLGMNGGTGGGDADTKYVYVY